MTVADLITAALKRINVLSAGAVPTADDLADAFLRLNDLMDAWQTENLTIPYIRRTTWTISSSKGTLASPYTVGTGGDVNVLRPTFISDIRYQDTSLSPTLEKALGIFTDGQWEALPQKNLTSTLPSGAYYLPTYSGSLGSLYLWPIPSSTTLQGVLYAPAGIAKFAATSDTIVLPPGYARFIRENLALDLSIEWRENIPTDPGLERSALESKANIKRANMRPMDMDLGLGGGAYDVNSDAMVIWR